MKLNDLRIGNYVGSGNQDVIVEAITEADTDSIDARRKDGLKYQYDLRFVLPIRFTPQWAKQFGFEIKIGTPANSKTRYFDFSCRLKDYRVYFSELTKISSVHFNASNGWFPELIEFEFVHQFQNIYYSLMEANLVIQHTNWALLIDAEKLYPVTYTIMQDGTKVIENTHLKGGDLTEKQIIEWFNLFGGEEKKENEKAD